MAGLPAAPSVRMLELEARERWTRERIETLEVQVGLLTKSRDRVEKSKQRLWELLRETIATQGEIALLRIRADYHMSVGVAAEAEIERLRAALEEIERTDTGHAADVARAALVAEEE